MRRPALVVAAFMIFTLQSCRKEFTCYCDGPGVMGPAYQIGTVQAANKEKADLMCTDMGNGNLCWAMQFE